MTGSGTQQDPYILTTWQELIDTTNRTTTDFCEWQGGDVDLNNIKPEGYTDSVVVNGIIDFKNATIKNLHTITSGYNIPIIFAFGTNGYIKNLNLLNCFFTGDYKYAIQFGKNVSSDMYLENLRIGIFLDLTNANSECTIISTSPDSRHYDSVFQKCSFNFRSDTQSKVCLVYGRRQDFYDCQLDFDIKSEDGYNVVENEYKADVYHSIIRGRYVGQTEAAKNFTGFNNHSNIYLFDEGSYTSNSQGITIYDSETCTITGTNVKGCTSTQMADTAYLKSIGFAIGD